MIGERHRCPNCRNPKSGERSVTFNSWDPRILASLPPDLTAEFPAELSHRNAISADVFALMRMCFNYGIGSKQFSHILLFLHHRYFSKLHVQYLDGLLAREKSHPAGLDGSYEAFSEFGDAQGYGGFAPSSSWLCMIYDRFIEDHGEQIDQKCAMCSADICAIDHSHKVCGTIRLVFSFLTDYMFGLDYKANIKGQWRGIFQCHVNSHQSLW